LEKNGNRAIIHKKIKNIYRRTKMESKFYEEDKLLIFKITDEIDDYNAQKIRRRADYEIERYMPRKVIFDFNSVTFMDSAGIGMLIGRYKTVNLIGGKLEIANISKSVEKIFEMCGILKLIPVINYEEKVG
jgi:stage II sporulation protein AA (anti-sigma F factor antagonist)